MTFYHLRSGPENPGYVNLAAIHEALLACTFLVSPDLFWPMIITKRVIEQFAYQKTRAKRDVRWDDEIRGLGVRIYPNGKKSFVLSYRVNGRKRLMTLGAFGTLTLDEARNFARPHLVTTRDASRNFLDQTRDVLRATGSTSR